MERIRTLGRKIFCLNPVLTILIAFPSFVFVIYTLTCGEENTIMAYASYSLSAYAMIISITGVVRIAKLGRKGIRELPQIQKIVSLPMITKYLEEMQFRTEAALYQGFFMNLVYVGIKLVSGVIYHSVWFGALSVYYMFLALMRFSLIHYVQKKEDTFDYAGEWKRYRVCGGILLFMNVALVAIVVLVVLEKEGFEYPGMLIYVMAAYTFYAITIAIINVVKYRKYGSPILSAAKVINLTAALVSILSLETAMLSQFGDKKDEYFRQIMTSVTGGVISVLVLGMAIFMLVCSTRKLGNLNEQQGSKRRAGK